MIVAIINVLVITFACFLIVKMIETTQRKREVIAETKPPISKCNWLLRSLDLPTLLSAEDSDQPSRTVIAISEGVGGTGIHDLRFRKRQQITCLFVFHPYLVS